MSSSPSDVIRFIGEALERNLHIPLQRFCLKKMNLNKKAVYGIRIVNRVDALAESLELQKEGVPVYPRKLIEGERLRSFIAGAFLASGSINSPSSKNYHLQMVLQTKEDADYFGKLLKRFHHDRQMDFKEIKKRNKWVLYLKKAEQITTFLALVYAHQCVFQFEDARIEKDFINSNNRYQICYNANYFKTVERGMRECEEIRKLQQSGAFYKLSEKERQVALFRLKYTDKPLSWLSENLKTEERLILSKSGVHHILQKIHDLYLEETDGKS